MQLPLVADQDFTGLVHASVALLIGAFFSAIYYLRVERSLRFLYGVAYAICCVTCLQWILPWALVTVRDERWGTR